MTAVSAQQAALRLLLDEVDPLVQRAENVGQVLTRVREELDADLQTLGKLVQQTLDAQPLILEAGRKLQASANRIETAERIPAGTGRGGLAARQGRGRPWRAGLVGALAGAVAVVSLGWYGQRELRGEARAGRALAAAWSGLDTAARARVQAAMAER